MGIDKKYIGVYGVTESKIYHTMPSIRLLDKALQAACKPNKGLIHETPCRISGILLRPVDRADRLLTLLPHTRDVYHIARFSLMVPLNASFAYILCVDKSKQVNDSEYQALNLGDIWTKILKEFPYFNSTKTSSYLDPRRVNVNSSGH